MTLPTFVAQVSAWVTDEDEVTPGVPTGTAANDVMVTWIATYGHQTDDPLITPAGWTRFASQTENGSGKMSLGGFWKVAGASETATTFTIPTTTTGYVYLAASTESWRGVDTSAPVNAFNTDSDTTVGSDVYLPGITTTVDDCVLSAYGAEWNYTNDSGFGPIAGWTLTDDVDGGYVAAYRRDYPTAGTLPPTDVGHTDLDLWLSGIVALKPTGTAASWKAAAVREWGGASWDPVVQKSWNGSSWATSVMKVYS